VDLLTARIINAASGGAVIGPWDVNQLDDVTVDVCRGFLQDYGTIESGYEKVEDIHRKWRNDHPTYKNRANRLH